MVKCPYCSRPAMSLARKSGLGPGRIVNCQSCGKPVTTHSMAVFAAIPAAPPPDDFNAPNPGVQLLLVQTTAPASGELTIEVELQPGAARKR